MNGFPIGTVCIITYCPVPRFIYTEVVVTSETFIWMSGQLCPRGVPFGHAPEYDGMLCQYIEGLGVDAPYPVAWLRRKGEDPDAGVDRTVDKPLEIEA